MQDRWVSGVFNDYKRASVVLKALSNHFDPHDISLFGSDPDELRELAVPDERAQSDKLIAVFGLLGGLLGLISGWFAVLPTGATVVVVPLLAAFMGAAAGWCLGVVFGAVVHFDVPPSYHRVTEARLKKGNVMIVVHARTRDQRYLAESIMDEFDVSDIIARTQEFAGLS